MSLAGLRVLSLESRRGAEIEILIRRQGGDPFVASSVKEQALDRPEEAMRFIESLEADEFDMVVCMTGSGITFLRDAVAATAPVERLAAALRRVTIVSRGPKPVGILRAVGVPVQVMIPEPNTWKEIVTAIAVRAERRIAVQEYGRSNPEMNAALEALGAKVTGIALYRWELPDDLARLREAVQRLDQGEVDVVLFTSSIQLEHLLEVARMMGREESVMRSLREKTVIVSIGPVMTASLESHGISPSIVPKHPKMASLVKAAGDQAHELLLRKRGG